MSPETEERLNKIALGMIALSVVMVLCRAIYMFFTQQF